MSRTTKNPYTGSKAVDKSCRSHGDCRESQRWILTEVFRKLKSESCLCWVVIEREVKPAYYDCRGIFLQFNTNKFYDFEDIDCLQVIASPAPPSDEAFEAFRLIREM